jgi:hypothetical protein
MPGASTLAPPGLVARSLGSTDTPRVLAPQSAAADIGARQVRRRHAGNAGHQVPDAVEINVGASLGARGGVVGTWPASGVGWRTTSSLTPRGSVARQSAHRWPVPAAAQLRSQQCWGAPCAAKRGSARANLDARCRKDQRWHSVGP